jgi:hypothetical protein
LYAAAVVGVPEIVPLLAFKLKPVGRLPLEIVHVIGVDPVATSLWLYALPTEAPGIGETVVICGTTEQVILNNFELIPTAFSALIPTLDVPDVVGIPEITPVLVLKLNPAGNLPL